MTAPRYPVEDESPRECCANLCMEIRERARQWREGEVLLTTFTSLGVLADWASRLERAVQRLDAERVLVGRYRSALEAITGEGKVCAEYETCAHAACASSYTSWSLADRALR